MISIVLTWPQPTIKLPGSTGMPNRVTFPPAKLMAVGITSFTSCVAAAPIIKKKVMTRFKASLNGQGKALVRDVAMIPLLKQRFPNRPNREYLGKITSYYPRNHLVRL